MRYRFAFLLLFTMLPVMNVLAAPVPEPSALLAIGPPPDPRQKEEDYRKNQKEAQTDVVILGTVLYDPAVKKLPSIARRKDAYQWLVENLRVTAERGGRRLRFTFRAGTRAEQVTILNAVLRANLSSHEGPIKCSEEWIRVHERNILDLEERIKATKNPQEAASYRKGIEELRSVRIPELRAAIARVKEIAVIRWAE
ncbi:MAG TPA: hypothetical protein VH643_15540 [Gemmataceae bacterium]|jgi:hypothetical protein